MNTVSQPKHPSQDPLDLSWPAEFARDFGEVASLNAVLDFLDPDELLRRHDFVPRTFAQRQRHHCVMAIWAARDRIAHQLAIRSGGISLATN